MFYFNFSHYFYPPAPLPETMNTDTDLGSFEGKYPKHLFKKSVIANGQTLGYVAKETEDLIVVFSDSDNSRFDIPKSKIEVFGSSVVVNESLDPYAVDKDSPLPESKSLRPSVEEIIQKASEIPEESTKPVEEYRPSAVEERAKDLANEFKGVGRELVQSAKTTKEKMEGLGASAASDMKEAARMAADGTSDLARTGARRAREKIAAGQSNTDASLSSDALLKIEKESRQPPTELDLGSYEGRYPKDFLNKTVLVNEQPIGYIAKETDDLIVVFSDTDSSTRFDIPKSEIALAGGSVVANEDLLFRYRKRRDSHMPPDRVLRPSEKEIRAVAAKLEVPGKRHTTPDAMIEEREYLTMKPRPETTAVSIPEGYVDTESELSKKVKSALAELREIVVAGTKVAKKRAKQAQLQASEKKAERDAEAISRMGYLSAKFADSFEEVLSEIRTRTYADQDQIYTGFLKLMDSQRELIVARRDLARRLKDSVSVPVVGAPILDAPPEDKGSSTPNERSITTKQKSTKTTRNRKPKSKSS